VRGWPPHASRGAPPADEAAWRKRKDEQQQHSRGQTSIADPRNLKYTSLCLVKRGLFRAGKRKGEGLVGKKTYTPPPLPESMPGNWPFSSGPEALVPALADEPAEDTEEEAEEEEPEELEEAAEEEEADEDEEDEEDAEDAETAERLPLKRAELSGFERALEAADEEDAAGEEDESCGCAPNQNTRVGIWKAHCTNQKDH
jgi:hypothetical protein